MLKVVRKALDCFFLLRIPLLAPVWTILILGWITGSGDARLGGCFRGSVPCGNEQLLWAALLGFSLVVASIYVTNQIADIESDRINHKLFLLPRGLVSLRTAWLLAGFCAGSGLAVAVCFFDVWMVGIFIASLILGLLYNFPPARLKDRAWGGTIANFLGHGMLTFLVGWYASRFEFPVARAELPGVIIASFSPGFANAAVYITTTIPDADGDRATGKHTFCVVYGPRTTAIVAALACLCAVAFSLKLEYNFWVMTVPSVLSAVLFVFLIISPRRESAFNAFKWPVFLLSAFVALFVPAYIALIVVTFIASRLYYKWRFNIEYPSFKAQ